MTLVPWTPILRGPQLGGLGNCRKGAGGQGIGFRSITAAAENLVTCHLPSSWWEARLFQLAGLKCGSEGRRRRRRSWAPVGAAHWAARSQAEWRVPEAVPYRGGNIQSRGFLFRAGGHMGPLLQRKSDRASLARQSQAQKMNRNGGNFCKPRAQWPGWNFDQPLKFCAPEILHSLSVARPP